MKKRVGIIAWVLLLVLALCCAASADTKTSGLFTYEFKGNGTLKIVDYDWSKHEGDLYIPSMLDGFEVAIIGEKAFDVKKDEYSKHRSDIVVTLPNTITGIEDFAFYRAPVSTINIPAATTSIGAGAFLTAPKAGSINFNVAKNHPVFATIDGVLYNKTKKELVAYNKFDGKGVFEIPKGIVSIADYAFYNDDKYGIGGKGGEYEIYDLFLNGHGVCRFYGITIPNTVTSIGKYALANNTAIGNKYIIPGSIQSIGEGAFMNVDEVAIKIPASLEAIPAKAFCGTGWQGPIPETVTSIGDSAFQASEVYDAVTIPGSVKSIGNSAFRNAKYLSDVVIEYGVQSIGDECFLGCKQTKTVTLPASVTSIGKDAFEREIVTLIVDQDSYAQSYAIENGIKYQYADEEEDLSWLTDGMPEDAEQEDTDWLAMGLTPEEAEQYAIEAGIDPENLTTEMLWEYFVAAGIAPTR